MNQLDRDVTLVRYDKTDLLSISSGLSLAEFAVPLSMMTRRIALNIKKIIQIWNLNRVRRLFLTHSFFSVCFECVMLVANYWIFVF